jgi:hypothetical protein
MNTHHSLLVLPALALAMALPQTAQAQESVLHLENRHVRLVVAADATVTSFTALDLDRNLAPTVPAPCAAITLGGNRVQATGATVDEEGNLVLEFERTDCRIAVAWTARDEYLIADLVAVDLPLTADTGADTPFAVCPLARNLTANVQVIPRPVSHVQAMADARIGFAGASVAVVACPGPRLRTVLQQVIIDAPGVPVSTAGGPWALDNPANRGSYLFNFSNLTEDTVDRWIDLAKSVGIDQIDFHGGQSFRFGDCEPNPDLYPNGLESLKAVIDRLHAAGLKAGLHTYAFFVAKDSRWVTPVPDPRLGKDGLYTLAEDLSADAGTVTVEEPLTGRALETGFFVRNSLTLQIGDELITYAGLEPEPPYRFTQCTRGAHGTRVSEHPAGTPVHHLKQCFFLFTPDAESDLLEEVAARTAEVYNTCGFDMIYLDALDGEGIVGGNELGWHYGSRFVYALVERLEKPPVLEMSTFHHHLWAVRSRMGAWDHPNRGHKRFIDIHCEANRDIARSFLPAHLGWWAVKTYQGTQMEPTYYDDIEYLLAKCVGHNVGFSIMGIDPDTIQSVPAYRPLGALMARYEELRRAGVFGPGVRERLREPGRDFALRQDAQEQWRFHPVQYTREVCRLTGAESVHRWSVENPYPEQAPGIRVEARAAAASWDAPDSMELLGFTALDTLEPSATAPGVTLVRDHEPERLRQDTPHLRIRARREVPETAPCWALVGARQFDPPLNLGSRQALGLWVYGDGRGEVLNIQLRSPTHITNGIGDHYVTVDFIGWKYVELIEPESERYADYQWPYGHPYSMFREDVHYDQVASVGIWLNDIPSEEGMEIVLGPIRALPVIEAPILAPVLEISGTRLELPFDMQTGTYLEMLDGTVLTHHARNGVVIQTLDLTEVWPTVATGPVPLAFSCTIPQDTASVRARVTLASRGPALAEE